MSKKYEQLTLKNREKLYELSQQKFQVNTMADLIGCHRATIYRELNRNKTNIGYLPDNHGWSPEIIAGCLKKEKGISVISHETIYAYIYSKEGRKDELYLSLKKRRKKRQSNLARKTKKTCIPNRVSIHERPGNIGTRDEFGHWEGDLVLFSHSNTNLITLRERKSRVFLAIKNPSKHADITSKNIIKKFKGRKKILIETLTLDNGGEFAKHEDIAKALRIDTFFCDPYSSDQKGSVENGNGVLRYDLPRSANIDSLSQKQIDKIVDKINNRPMKCLGFKTPSEVFMGNYGQVVGNG